MSRKSPAKGGLVQGCSNNAFSTAHCTWLVIFAFVIIGASLAEGGVGSDTVNAVFNKPDLKLPLSQIASTEYLDRMAQLYQQESDADPGAIYDMLVAQQRWRRGAKPDDKYIGSPHDCQPTYKISKSTTKWFHTRTYEVLLCFTVCAGYPHCTHTTPLVGTEDTALSLLLRCGLRALKDSKQEVIVVANLANGSARPICRNVVDRGVPMPGVSVINTNTAPRQPPGASSNTKGMQVQAFTRSANAHQGEFMLFTHNLWSHWRASLMSVAKTNTAASGAQQALLMPTQPYDYKS